MSSGGAVRRLIAVSCGGSVFRAPQGLSAPGLGSLLIASATSSPPGIALEVACRAKRRPAIAGEVVSEPLNPAPDIGGRLLEPYAVRILHGSKGPEEYGR
ncbi:MAG: hypothetical protein KGS00_14670 [Alphaproteobacteria bacterium]|nr:hypothetical protein [Alphaproteobacteria bacterium]